jgi:hypothetical protein
MGHARRGVDSQNPLIRKTVAVSKMSLAMNPVTTRKFLRSLCAAAYPLISLAAAAAAVLCVIAPPVAAQHAVASTRVPTCAEPAATIGQEAAITPHATRAPELPVGCVA